MFELCGQGVGAVIFSSELLTPKCDTCTSIQSLQIVLKLFTPSILAVFSTTDVIYVDPTFIIIITNMNNHFQNIAHINEHTNCMMSKGFLFFFYFHFLQINDVPNNNSPTSLNRTTAHEIMMSVFTFSICFHIESVPVNFNNMFFRLYAFIIQISMFFFCWLFIINKLTHQNILMFLFISYRPQQIGTSTFNQAKLNGQQNV